MVLAFVLATKQVAAASAAAFVLGVLVSWPLCRLRTRRLGRQADEARANFVAVAAERHALLVERATHDERAAEAEQQARDAQRRAADAGAEAAEATARAAALETELVAVRAALSGCERGLAARQEQIDALTAATGAQHRRIQQLQQHAGAAPRT